ncbi:MAG: hypothetical protein IJW83_05645 [Clostridia bacterium]|nr:hypothetical protein [Clostridia bacterium]
MVDNFHISTGATKYRTRAIFYPSADGHLKMARIENFSRPTFRRSGWEDSFPPPVPPQGGAQKHDGEGSADNVRRAVRRAQTAAFDAIMCNPDLNLFATVTFSPEKVDDKADYDECFKYLNTFLSNRVRRRGLKYICAAELTKVGDIHFHMICNADALQLARAVNVNTGKPLSHKGKPLYNLTEWTRGFSSAEFISADEFGNARERVSKYIFKYIGKAHGGADLHKVGGRYLLKGGELKQPVVLLGDSPDEFTADVKTVYEKHLEIADAGCFFDVYYYV